MSYITNQPLTSFWLDKAEWDDVDSLNYLQNTPIDNNQTFDAIIIGAGFSGLSTAYWLIKENVFKASSILIVDSRGIAEGASGRNGGHCWPSLYVPEEDSSPQEIEDIREVNEWIMSSVHDLIQFIEENHIDCDLKKTGAINAYHYSEEIREGREYLNCIKECKYDSYLTLEDLDQNQCKKLVNSDYIIGGMYQPIAYQLWPVKLFHYLAKLLLNEGVNIKTHTHINEISKSNELYSLSFNGGSFTCRNLILATNAYTSMLVPSLKDHIVPTRGQVIATSPLPRYSSVSLSLNDGSEYLIQRVDDGRVIYGGMRWRSPTKETFELDDSKINETISEAINESFKELFGLSENDYKVTHEWTGIMGYVSDRYPLVGRLEVGENKFIVAGYTGNGMPKCFGAGRLIARIIKEKKNYLIKKLDPQRFNKPLN